MCASCKVVGISHLQASDESEIWNAIWKSIDASNIVEEFELENGIQDDRQTSDEKELHNDDEVIFIPSHDTKASHSMNALID